MILKVYSYVPYVIEYVHNVNKFEGNITFLNLEKKKKNVQVCCVDHFLRLFS